MDITFVGHSTVLLELDGTRLLTDPVLRAQLLHLRRHAAPVAAGVTQRIDAVLISHLHGDHLDPPSLRRVDPDARVLAPRGAAPVLRRCGHDTIEELVAGDSVSVGAVSVTAVRAEHQHRRWPVGGASARPLGYEVRGEGGSLYFAGDTDVYEAMGEMAGRIDVALLPVWGWGTTLGPGHMDPRGAAKAAALIRPRIAIPIHWGTLFPVGRARRHGHLLTVPPRDFARHVAQLAPEVEVVLLEPGESRQLGFEP